MTPALFTDSTGSLIAKTNDVMKEKGKFTVFHNYSFNDNGVLTSKSVRLLDEGKLSIQKCSRTKWLIWMLWWGKVYAKDVLHHAILGTVQELIPRLDALTVEEFKLHQWWGWRAEDGPSSRADEFCYEGSRTGLNVSSDCRTVGFMSQTFFYCSSFFCMLSYVLSEFL